MQGTVRQENSEHSKNSDNQVMRLFITTFASFFLILQLHSQQIVFDKAYDFILELEGAGAVLVEDNEFVIAGITTSRTFNGGDAVKLFKIDSIGNVIWHKEAGRLGYEVDFGTSGSLRKTRYGEYIWGGGIEDTLNFISDVFLVKFDEFGDTVFTRVYGSNGEDRGYSVVEAKDGGYAIIGQTEGMGDPDGDYYLIKTDSSGNFLWEKTYGGPRLDRGIDIEATNDGGFLLGGGGEINGSLFQGYVIKTDSLGNVKWNKVYGGNKINCGTYIDPVSEGGFVFSACLDTVVNAQNSDKPHYVAKADSIGNIIWQRFMSEPEVHDIIMVREISQGGYIFCGRILDVNLNDKIVGWIKKLDKDGNVLWERRYAHKNTDLSFNLAPSELWDIQPTQDGGFIAAGKTFETFTADFWVLKLDSNGCLGNYCGLTDTNCYYQTWPCPDSTVEVSEMPSIENQETRLKVYPNPTNDVIYFHVVQKNFSIEKIILHDIKGRIILEAAQQSDLNIATLPNGIYFYEAHLSYQNQALQIPARGKIIKQ